MNLYDSNGELDLDAATLELAGNGQVSNEGLRRESVARLSAAALLDIAGSLRVLALESALAMGQSSGYADPTVPDDEVGDEVGTVAMRVDVVDAESGTPVRLKVPDSKGRQRTGILDGRDGLDSGEPWVGVYWDDAPDDAAKVFAANLEAFDGDVENLTRAQIDAILEAGDSAPDLPIVSDAPEPERVGYHDDDFAEPDPIALLEARQDKASKKGKAKK